MTYWSAFIIGVSQAIAIMPGISRSGATISTSVLLGVDRSKAARFSFLMVVPLILGAMAKDLMSGEITYTSEQINAIICRVCCCIFYWYSCLYLDDCFGEESQT